MLTTKTGAAAIAIALAALLGLQAYSIHSLRRTVETRLTQIENGIDSVRSADAALAAEVAAQPTKTQASTPAHKDAIAAGTERTVADRKLQAQLQRMLPRGTDLKQAAAGFKNEREFISAVHVSKNLAIPFGRLKAEVTGKHAVSLEAAIRELRPGLTKAKAKAEAAKGERQAMETAKLSRSTPAGA
jgi:ribosome-associated translation inhibitor RaiA